MTAGAEAGDGRGRWPGGLAVAWAVAWCVPALAGACWWLLWGPEAVGAWGEAGHLGWLVWWSGATAAGEALTAAHYREAAGVVVAHGAPALLVVGLAPLPWLWRGPAPVAALRAVGRWAVALAVYAGVAQVVVFSQAEYPGLHNWPTATFAATIALRAEKPFANRILTPWLVRELVRRSPPGLRQRVGDWARGDGHLQHLMRLTREVRGHEYAFVVALAVLTLAYVAGLLCLGHLADRLFALDWITARLALPVACALLHPLLFQINGYLYDLPNFAFCAAGLWLVCTRRVAAFNVLLPLAVLNKESAVTLTVVFAVLLVDRLPRRTYAASLAWQVVAVGVLRGWLVPHLNAGLPGAAFEYPLGHNLAWLARENVWYFLTGGDRGLYHYPYAAYLAVLLLAGWGWRGTQPDLRRIGWVYLLFFLPLVTVFGLYPEWRIFTEALPLLVLLAWAGLARLAGQPLAPRPGLAVGAPPLAATAWGWLTRPPTGPA